MWYRWDGSGEEKDRKRLKVQEGGGSRISNSKCEEDRKGLSQGGGEPNDEDEKEAGEEELEEEDASEEKQREDSDDGEEGEPEPACDLVDSRDDRVFRGGEDDVQRPRHGAGRAGGRTDGQR